MHKFYKSKDYNIILTFPGFLPLSTFRSKLSVSKDNFVLEFNYSYKSHIHSLAALSNRLTTYLQLGTALF